MNQPSKLTLRLDSGLIKDAKAFALKNERSLSQLVADYFSRLGMQSAPRLSSKGRAIELHSSQPKRSELSPATLSLRGALKKPGLKPPAKRRFKTDPDKSTYRQHLENKHL
jgi:hypothetical protein